MEMISSTDQKHKLLVCSSDFLHGKESSKEPKEKKKHKFPKLPKLKASGHKSEASTAAAGAQAAGATMGASRQSTASAPPLQTIDEVSESREEALKSKSKLDFGMLK